VFLGWARRIAMTKKIMSVASERKETIKKFWKEIQYKTTKRVVATPKKNAAIIEDRSSELVL
jgi:hypothetical protein